MNTKPKIIPVINDIFVRASQLWFEFGFIFRQHASKMFIFSSLFFFFRCGKVNLTLCHRSLVIGQFKLCDRYWKSSLVPGNKTTIVGQYQTRMTNADRVESTLKLSLLRIPQCSSTNSAVSQ